VSTKTALVRGGRLAYEVTGTGPDVIWGHGLSLNRASDADMGLLDWERIPVSVVRYDARSHGASDAAADLGALRWTELARDQLALADALGIDSYVAAGASMGCGTALHAAVLGGDRIKALVLALPPTGWEARAAQAAQWELTAETIENQGIEALIAARALLDPPDPYKGDERRRALQAAATRAWEPSGLALVMRGAAGANLPDRADIAQINVPVLILAWTGDPIHPIATVDELTSLLPDTEVHVASTADDLSSWTDVTNQFLARVLHS
jgi:3-oxoadipate enol-lactonase